MQPPEVVLASSSVYRRELLQRILPDFHCQSPDVDEQSFHTMEEIPENLAARLAYEKAVAIARDWPNAVVIGSDQLVNFDGVVLGKPGSSERAIQQLCAMSGSSHQLVTAVCLLFNGRRIAFTNITTLTMRQLDSSEAGRYVDRDQPLDCAGSYRIESLGIALFEKIETSDFTSIIGLPLIQLAQELRRLGVAIP